MAVLTFSIACFLGGKEVLCLAYPDEVLGFRSTLIGYRPSERLSLGLQVFSLVEGTEAQAIEEGESVARDSN